MANGIVALLQILYDSTGHFCWIGLLLVLLSGCRMPSNSVPPRDLKVQQTWELQPGQDVAGHAIVAGLGDVSVALRGEAVRSPFNGEVQPATQANCVIFSSPEVPAYLFRLCGLRNPRLGRLKAGQKIGSGDYLHFAALRRQPDGTWVIVEPASTILERMLEP